MKKILAILTIALTLIYTSCTDGKLCPYTGDIIYWSSQVAQKGFEGAQVEELGRAALKAGKLDSVAIYGAQLAQIAVTTLQYKDSLIFYTDQCKSEGFVDTTVIEQE